MAEVTVVLDATTVDYLQKLGKLMDAAPDNKAHGYTNTVDDAIIQLIETVDPNWSFEDWFDAYDGHEFKEFRAYIEEVASAPSSLD